MASCNWSDTAYNITGILLHLAFVVGLGVLVYSLVTKTKSK